MLDFLNSLASPTSLIIFTVTLLLVYIINSWLKHPSDLPPVPCMPIPILGHITYFKPSFRDVLMKWKKQVGKIFSFYIGSKLIIAINSYDLLNEAFVKQADRFTDRPLPYPGKLWKEYLCGIAHNSGESWKEQRGVTVSLLRAFGMGKNWLAEKISEEVEEYITVIEGMKGEARDLQLLTDTAVCNVICAILVGNRFDYDDPFLREFVQQNHEQLKIRGKMATADAFPWIRFLPGDIFGVNKLMNSLLSQNKIFSEKFINQFKDNADDTSTDNFIKAYIREMNKRGDSGLNETHLSRIIDVLFIAGTDTTSSTLMWAYAFSVHHPECQEKIYKEILEEVGTERIPNMQDKPKLRYLNAFILESQRIGSVVPLGAFHKCSETTEVGGYRIPEGATIIPYLDAILKDETAWNDPSTFRPERFLDKDGKIVIPDEFVPFSLGRRVCLGESLANMELFLFLSTIFQRFEILPEDPNNLPPLVNVIGFTSSVVPFKAIMKARPRL